MLNLKRIPPHIRWGALSIAALAAVGINLGSGEVFAKVVGTAKPPPPPPATATCNNGQLPCLVVNPPVAPAMGASATASVGFQITGFIQNATVTNGCGAGSPTDGGTVTVDGIVVTVPSNTIIQFPASTQTWRSAVCPAAANAAAVPPIPVAPPIALDGTGGNVPLATPSALSSVEITIVGNILGGGVSGTAPALNGSNGVHTAGLIYVSQQSLNSGSGYIDSIDYTDGSIYVKSAANATGSLIRLLINDPNGRFGRAQTSPDARFSVDSDNPTITAANSGYPMCVPRSLAAPVRNADGTYTNDDPFCPQRNRPRVNQDPTALAGLGCRNFADAGLPVAAGRLDLAAPAAGQQICSSFVMKAVAGMPGTGAPGWNAAWIANIGANGAGDADPRQQAPLEVGDYITWSGTLVRGISGARVTTTHDTIWVHTIAANVGIFTQPRTLPAYVHVGEFRIGVEPTVKAVGVAALPGGVETTNRFVAEASVSDISSIVDFYLYDLVPPGDDRVGSALAPDLVVGRPYNRWLTPESMTGTLAGQTAAPPLGSASWATAQPFGGGITTQYDGPSLGRARMRAIKVPAIVAGAGCVTGPGSSPVARTGCDLTASPARYLRAVVRQLCAPATTAKVTTPADGVATDTIEPNFTGINKVGVAQGVTAVPGSSSTVAAGSVPSSNPDPLGSCGSRAQFANGLFTGQYLAPVTEFIFAEKIQTGIPAAPNNFWQIDFMVKGEGGLGGNSTAPQSPLPGEPVAR